MLSLLCSLLIPHVYKHIPTYKSILPFVKEPPIKKALSQHHDRSKYCTGKHVQTSHNSHHPHTKRVPFFPAVADRARKEKKRRRKNSELAEQRTEIGVTSTICRIPHWPRYRVSREGVCVPV